MNPRMRPAPLVSLCLLLLGTVGTLVAVPLLARAGSQKLSTNYPYLAGDDIARRMGGVFRVTAGLAPGALVDYDRRARTITVEIIGSGDEVAGAKREIEAFAATIRERIVPYAKDRHGVSLDDRDVTLIYFNDGGEEAPYEVVRRQDGKFLVPPPTLSGEN